MQVARRSSALARTEFGHVNIISAPRLSDGVHGLVNISDKMHQEFQCFNSVLPGRAVVGQHQFEKIDTVNHAVVVVV